MKLSDFDGRACAARRSRLALMLGDRPALIAAGAIRPRTSANTAYPFRAASHFLYLFGLHLPRACGLWTGDRWVLYVPEPGPDFALWHGPAPGPAQLSDALACPVELRPTLPAALAGKSVATLPALDAETREEQAELLGRPVKYGKLDALDEPLADAIISMRLIHDCAGISAMRQAAAATVAAYHAGLHAVRPGIKECVVRAALEAELVKRDMTVSYNSIVSVHGEVLHNEVYHHELMPNDLLLVDAGGETADGWAADVTRTWPVSGRFSPAQRDCYQVVLNAQKKVIAAVQPGRPFRELHLMAAQLMAEGLIDLGLLRGDPAELVADGAVALFFPHGLGHLIGLDVHDMEDLGDRATYAPGRSRSTQPGLRTLRLDRELAPGMAITIEPGLYFVPAILEDPARTAVAGDRLRRDRLAAFADVRGIRIEDDVVVKDEGHEVGYEVLTAAIPKEADDIEKEMARPVSA
jgi:Xaa-Pro aminopeptidase